MSKKDKTHAHRGDKGPTVLKEKCCEKYKKKGRHCRRCPMAADCPLPE